jgi:hypothetical protein
VLAVAIGCGIHYHHLEEGTFAGRVRVYDYSPTAIQSGNVLQLWWCGQDDNATDRTQISDAIEYESINLANNSHYGPVPVLGETQYAWDGAYTCNPKVIGGAFVNPLGNGKTYSYALYYVATDLVQGGDNRIGVAFSNNGKDWEKYPHPIILPETLAAYGIAQPAAYNTDHQSAIRLFYEDSSQVPGVQEHVASISTDGVHFVKQGILTTNGLDPNNPNPTWGDMAYDAQTGYWYALFNLPFRDPSTTGGAAERGQYGVQLYRIPDASLFTGATPWQLLTVIDTSLTGYESNFIAGFLRDRYGSLNLAPYPTLRIFTSITNPPPPWNTSPYLAAALYGATGVWDIGEADWVPGAPMRTLNRYFNQTTYESTTGWVDPSGGFVLQTALGHLYEAPQQGAATPFFSCKSGSTDYFVSLDPACAGARILGTLGYGYQAPVANLNLVALYRCSLGGSDFVSKDSACEGKASGQLLGYALR